MLYIADELFFSGTAAEITPIRSVDKITVGNGIAGPITKAIREEFYGIVNGKAEDRHWLADAGSGKAAGHRVTEVHERRENRAPSCSSWPSAAASLCSGELETALALMSSDSG